MGLGVHARYRVEEGCMIEATRTPPRDKRDHSDIDVIVVGAGPAGLAAAKYLADAGRRAIVLEKRPIAGGKLSSWRDADGDWLESGLHSFFGGYKELRALLAEVGIAHHVLWQPHALTFALPAGLDERSGSEAVFEDFRFLDLPSPFNGIGAVLGAKRLFNTREKLLFATGTYPVLLRNHGYALGQDDVDYATWHRARGMSEHMLRAFFAPMALALNFTPADAISAQAMLRVMAYFASTKDASRPGFLDGPPSERFIDPLVEYVRGRGQHVETSARVGEILFENGRAAGVRLDDGRELRGAAVILATPVHDAARLLPADMLRDPMIRGVDRPVTSRRGLVFGAGSLVPVHADLGQASPGYGWRDGSFIEACIAPADDLMALDDEAVLERVLSDLQRFYPLGTRDRLVKAKLVRIPRSVYRASPGAERLRPGARTPVANLFLSGCYTDHGFPASVEGAVRSARVAVDGALATLGARA
jgi:15-cis-phytoene desaturase